MPVGIAGTRAIKGHCLPGAAVDLGATGRGQWLVVGLQGHSHHLGCARLAPDVSDHQLELEDFALSDRRRERNRSRCCTREYNSGA